jgi:hypothetical protein
MIGVEDVLLVQCANDAHEGLVIAPWGPDLILTINAEGRQEWIPLEDLGGAGPQGATGPQGAQGGSTVGTQGTQGPQGTQGASPTGPQGTQGVGGAQGVQGTQGNAGFAGFAGTQGPQGTTGTQGPQGTPPGGGGPTTTPDYIASGSPVALSAAQNPAYGTNASGDLFVMQIYARGTITTAPTAPSGWTLIGSNVKSFSAQWAYRRDARSTGGESGTVTIPSIVVSGGIAVIHTFRNVATSSFIEDVTASSNDGDSETAIPAPTVAAADDHRLAVGLVGRGADEGSRVSWTGESGGDWVEVYDFTTGTGTDSAIQMQVADLDAGGTITGGSQTDGISDRYNVIGFALVGT